MIKYIRSLLEKRRNRIIDCKIKEALNKLIKDITIRPLPEGVKLTSDKHGIW